MAEHDPNHIRSYFHQLKEGSIQLPNNDIDDDTRRWVPYVLRHSPIVAQNLVVGIGPVAHSGFVQLHNEADVQFNRAFLHGKFIALLPANNNDFGGVANIFADVCFRFLQQRWV